MASTCIAPAPALLNNRYQILRILEDGPWSMAWLAEDTHLPSHRQCIVRQVKALTTDEQIQKQLCDRIQTEVSIWQCLGGIHDQIPWLSSFKDAHNQIYLIEEWVPGQTLAQTIQESGPLNEDTVLDILRKLLSLVDYLHKNQVLHCVLEPSNILLRADDHKPVLQYGGLLNQVIAQTFLEYDTQPMPWIPPSGYLPQEQANADRLYESSNLYSLGLMGIYLLTGRDPNTLFNRDLYTQNWRLDISAEASALAVILNQAISQFPTNRFVSAQQMVRALRMASRPLGQQSQIAQTTLVA